MKHIDEVKLDGVECVICHNCGDQMSLQDGDWPFWMQLVLKAGFADIHSGCEPDAKRTRSVHESLTCERRK